MSMQTLSGWAVTKPPGGGITDPAAYVHISTEKDYSILVEAYQYAMDRHPTDRQAARPVHARSYNLESWKLSYRWPSPLTPR